jgi:hypothetical protein
MHLIGTKSNEMNIFLIACCLILNSCTYSVNLIHSEGQATDLIDENQKADADVRPNLNIPI